MRVTVVSLDESGGHDTAPVSHVVCELSAALAAHRNDVTVMTDLDSIPLWMRAQARGPGSLRAYPLSRLPMVSDAVSVRYISANVLELPTDVILAFGPRAGRVAEEVSRVAGTPWAWVADIMDSDDPQALDAFRPTSADAVIASTRWELDRLVEAGVERARAHQLPLQLVPTRSAVLEPVATRVRIRQIGAALDAGGEGPRLLVSALASLPSMSVTFMDPSLGVGDSRVRAEMHQQVRLLARHFHVEDRVSIVDVRSQAEVDELMRRSDVATYLAGSPPPLPFLCSAMSSGAVAVVVAGCGADDVVENGITGLCLQAPDVRQLVTSLRVLDRDPTVRDTMAGTARRRVRESYHSHPVGSALNGLLSAIATTSPVPAVRIPAPRYAGV